MQTRTMKYQKVGLKNQKEEASKPKAIEGIDLFFEKIVKEDLKKKNVNRYRKINLNNGQPLKKVKIEKKIKDFEQ